jgi:hypothetical protein
MSLVFNLDEVSPLSAFSDDSADLPRVQEVRLTTSNADRERIEELANLYSLIVSLNYLERAYVRDSITASQCADLLPFSVASQGERADYLMWGYPLAVDRYAPACTKLLAQYKTIMKLVGDTVPSLDAFLQEYRVCLLVFSSFDLFLMTLFTRRWTALLSLIGYVSVSRPRSSMRLRRTAATEQTWRSRSPKRRRCVRVPPHVLLPLVHTVECCDFSSDGPQTLTTLSRRTLSPSWTPSSSSCGQRTNCTRS